MCVYVYVCARARARVFWIDGCMSVAVFAIVLAWLIRLGFRYQRLDRMPVTMPIGEITTRSGFPVSFIKCNYLLIRFN